MLLEDGFCALVLLCSPFYLAQVIIPAQSDIRGNSIPCVFDHQLKAVYRTKQDLVPARVVFYCSIVKHEHASVTLCSLACKNGFVQILK